MIQRRRLLNRIVCTLMIFACLFVLSACGEEYKLTFVVDGETYHTINSGGEEVLKLPEDPTIDGYTFSGWYLDENVWENEFSENTYKTKEITKNISIFAKFDVVTYNITYQTDNGTHSNPDTYTVEDSIELAGASKAGHVFSGWYDAETGGSKVEEITIGSTGNKTFYARWDITTYTIDYKNGKDATNNNPTNYNVTTPTFELINLTKTGYEFDGWYDAETGGSKVEEITIGSTGNKTLYARWNVTTYKIVYENTKSATNSNPGGYNVDTATIKLVDLEKDGYKFDGWYTALTGGSKVEEITIGSTGNKTFYARWTATTYSVNYNNTKDVANSNPATYTIETATTKLVDLEKDGYKFDGWYTALTGGSKVEEITIGSTGNKTFYARWTVTTYSVNYNNTKDVANSNPATYTIETTTTKLVDLEKDGYKFDGWYTALTGGSKVEEITIGSTGNKTLYARWNVTTYSVNYNNTKDVANTNPTSYNVETAISLAVLSDENYDFVGWFDAATEGNEVKEIAVGTTGNKELYARWTPKAYKINYENTKDVTNSNPTSYTIETATFSLAVLSHEHYNFVGWFDAATEGNEVKEIVVGTTGNKELYARWTPKAYTIDYVDSSNATQTEKDIYNIETPTFALPIPSRLGYIFAGWYDADEAGSKVEEITIGSTGNKTLYARWEVKPFSITYVDENEVEHANPKTYTILSETIALQAIEKVGFLFDGWYDSETGGNQVLSIPAGSTGDIILYAQWRVYEITISYDTAKVNLKDTDVLNAELFSASAIDNDGETISVTVTYTGEFKAGSTINVILTATSRGVTQEVEIEDIKVYGTPTIKQNGSNYLYTDDNLDLLFTAIDSFNEPLIVSYSTEGTKEEGNIIVITVETTDSAQNNASTTFTYTMLGAKEGLFKYNKTALSDVKYGWTITGLTTAGSTITNLVIPYELEGTVISGIDEEAFLNNTTIVHLELPDNLVYIHYSAFSGCSNLVTMRMSNNMQSLRASAFAKTGLREVILPDTLEVVGGTTFQDCKSLGLVYMPSSINSMNRPQVFAGCDNLTLYCEPESRPSTWSSNFNSSSRPAYWGVTRDQFATIDGIHYLIVNENAIIAGSVFNIESIIIPETVTINEKTYNVVAVGANAFDNCTSLTTIQLPSTVLTIGENAFKGCTKLETIQLLESLQTIGANAFENCTSLITIQLPSTVLTIGANAFNGCTKLANIQLSESLQTIGANAFENCTGLTSIAIPSSVNTILADAFEGAANIKSVYITDVAAWCNITFANSYSNPMYYNANLYLNDELVVDLVIPDTVDKLNDFAFYHCTSLKTVVVADTVKSIGASAFSGCTSLTNVTLSSTLETIRANAFYNTKLASIAIPATLTAIGESAFSSVTTLKNVYITDVAAWCNISFVNLYSNPMYYNANLYLNEELAVDLVIPDTVDKLNNFAFYHCTSLKTVVVADTVKSIGASAFSGCTSLTNVTLSNTLETIRANAFYNTKLASLTIPATLTAIGESAFADVTTLKNVYITDLVAWLKIDFGTYITSCPLVYGANLYLNDVLLEDLVIPEEITVIKEKAFVGCVSLKTVKMPYTVTTIGQSAFEECHNITSVELSTSLTTLGKWAFYNCKSLVDITVPASLTSTSTNVFEKSTMIKNVYITDIKAWCNISFGDNYSNPLYYKANLYLNNVLVEDLVIPNDVTTIKARAFINCGSLKTVVIPSTVTTIGAYAFTGCTATTITCDVTVKPSGWNTNWNSSNIDVIWKTVEETTPEEE